MLGIDRMHRSWRWTTGNSSPNNQNVTTTLQHVYKPKALRLPSLLSLFFLFCIALAGLEMLLGKTIDPTEYYASHGLRAPSKRQAPILQCPSPEELDKLRNQHSAMCRTYTTVFKPSTTSLDPPMQTSFDLWLAGYSSMEVLSQYAESCVASNSLVQSLSSLFNTVPVSISTGQPESQLTSSPIGGAASATTNSASQPFGGSNANTNSPLNSVTPPQQTTDGRSSASAHTTQSPNSTRAGTSLLSSSTTARSLTSEKGTTPLTTSHITTTSELLSSTKSLSTTQSSTTKSLTVSSSTTLPTNNPSTSSPTSKISTAPTTTTSSTTSKTSSLIEGSEPTSPSVVCTGNNIGSACTCEGGQPCVCRWGPRENPVCMSECAQGFDGQTCSSCGGPVCSCHSGLCQTTCNDDSSCEGISTPTNTPSVPTPAATSNAASCDPTQLECSTCSSDSACYCSSEGICQPPPCHECEFLNEGQVMSCPESCVSAPATGTGFLVNRSLLMSEDDLYQHRGRNLLRRQGIEILTGNFQTPIRDAWNYLLWTEPLTIRRTSSSVVSTVTTATFTLDVWPGGSTSWPTLTSTPPIAVRPTEPACVPATLFAPAPAPTTIVKRNGDLRSANAYVTRESTTVVVKIRDNYLQMTSNIPTITKTGTLDTGKAYAQGAQVTSTTAVLESVGPNGRRTTQSVVVVQPTGGPLQASNPNDLRVSPTKLTKDKRVVRTTFTQATYFLALYAPTILAVLIKMLFETVIAAFKMVEVFEVMHRSTGALAENSLFSQYLSSSLSFDVIDSIISGRTLPLWTVSIFGLISVVAPLSSASMTVRPMDMCTKTGIERPCAPAWIVDVPDIRIIQALLIVCMVLTLVLIYDSWNYHAGISCNPTSIAAVAVLLNYEPLRAELQNIDPHATEHDMSKALENYHFWLSPHQPTRTESRYGIIHSPGAATTPSSWVDSMERVRKVLTFEARSLDYLHFFIVTSLFALLATYRANRDNNAFNYFFASATFWPKILLVGIAVVIDMQWKNLEREVRITEPYRRLHKGNARPENTILWPLNGTCWSNSLRIIRAITKYDDMWFEALIALTTILSDVNIIAVAGVLMSNSQTEVAYEFSSITALTCTSVMLVTLLVTMIWWRRQLTLPRKPETVAAVMSYLCISRMAMDFAELKMEFMTSEERDQIILSKGRRYRFGLMMGEDGRERYCVDYDDDTLRGEDGSDRESWLTDRKAAGHAVRLST